MEQFDDGSAVAECLGGEHRDRNERDVRGGLRRERVVAAAEEDIGERHRGGGRDDCRDKMDAAAGECERVERDRRRHHRDRAGGVVEREQGEHEPAGKDERRRR